MTIAAAQRNAGHGNTLLRPHDVSYTLAIVAPRKEGHTEVCAILIDRGRNFMRTLIRNIPKIGRSRWRVVIRCGEGL